LGDGRERLAAARRSGHGEALEAQRALQGRADGGLVVDDEDEWLRGDDRAPPLDE
jgi:hypothetical protein